MTVTGGNQETDGSGATFPAGLGSSRATAGQRAWLGRPPAPLTTPCGEDVFAFRRPRRLARPSFQPQVCNPAPLSS